MRRIQWSVVLATLAVAVLVPTGTGGALGKKADGPRLNDIQILGTHNSYHRRPDRVVTATEGANYEHAPLDVQLDDQGIRNLEIDAYNGPDLPVFHSLLVDSEASCPTLRECLGTIAEWSDDHRRAVPLIVFIEPKRLPTNPVPGIQTAIDAEAERLGLAAWDAKAFDRLDRVVRNAFGRRLVTPDEVRGKRRTLRDAVLRDGWPLLADVRGGVLIVLNVAKELRALYLDGHRSLRDRPMFVPSHPDNEYAAFVKRDLPTLRTSGVVEQGFLVSTRADANGSEARAGDLTRADAAIESGAHVVVTDYPVPDATVGAYTVRLPGGGVARCNPVHATRRCRDRDLEKS